MLSIDGVMYADHLWFCFCMFKSHAIASAAVFIQMVEVTTVYDSDII
jgi:hypothetical protein